MLVAVQLMGKFQRVHNNIRPDFILLLQITEEHKYDDKKFDALYRACVTRFFTLIEADIYGLNQLDMYEGYDDKKDRFIEKFKETYKQICQTWNKEDLQKKYFDSKLQGLIELKRKRDELVHPKELIHLSKATENDFNILKGVFKDYDKFINDLMNDFFVSTKMDSSFLF
ncbi:MAG: hypothetical protein J7502_17350 [Flavisolibacter sp.]|nr:hypothetical protein [Flavisolibacter sp.]